MDPQFTSFDTTLDQRSLYYNVNRELSEELVAKVQNVQRAFATRFEGSVFLPTKKELHSTLMLWSRTELEKDENMEDRMQYLNSIYPSYSQSLKKILATQTPFDVHFDTLKLTSKTIILIGTDNGQHKAIREPWWHSITPTEKTPPLPNIIHSTVLVFTKPVERKTALEILDTHPINHTERVDNFRLVRETKMRAQEFEEVERYPL